MSGSSFMSLPLSIFLIFKELPISGIPPPKKTSDAQEPEVTECEFHRNMSEKLFCKSKKILYLQIKTL